MFTYHLYSGVHPLGVQLGVQPGLCHFTTHHLPLYHFITVRDRGVVGPGEGKGNERKRKSGVLSTVRRPSFIHRLTDWADLSTESDRLTYPRCVDCLSDSPVRLPACLFPFYL